MQHHRHSVQGGHAVPHGHEHVGHLVLPPLQPGNVKSRAASQRSLVAGSEKRGPSLLLAAQRPVVEDEDGWRHFLPSSGGQLGSHSRLARDAAELVPTDDGALLVGQLGQLFLFLLRVHLSSLLVLAC